MKRQAMLKQLDQLRMAVKKLPATTHYDIRTTSGTVESPGDFGSLQREVNGTHTITILVNGGTQDYALKGRL